MFSLIVRKMPNVIENSQQIGIIDIPTKLSFPVHPKSAQNEPGMCKGVIGPGNQSVFVFEP